MKIFFLCAVLLAAMLFPGAAIGRQAYLVRDFNTYPLTAVPFGRPSSFAAGPTALLFNSANRIYRTDGTTGGTSVVYDAMQPQSGRPENLTYWNGRWFFAQGGDLWTTDGTSAGTRVFVPATYMTIVDFYPAGDRLFFRGWGGSGPHEEIWCTDGTPEGSVLVRTQLSEYTRPPIVVYKGAILFAGTENGNWSLWRSDGTPEGTMQVHPVGLPKYLVEFKGEVYFAGNDENGTELWRTDGTSEGTVRVADIVKGPGSSAPTHLVAASDWLFFAATDGVHGAEPWRSDGTAKGTRMVRDLLPGPNGSALRVDIALADGNVVYFNARAAPYGGEMFKSDGTEEGTGILMDIDPGTASSSISFAVVIDGMLYFNARTGGLGQRVWKSDGTDTGTDVLPGELVPENAPIHAFDGYVWFPASVAIGNQYAPVLMRSDGTPDGTSVFFPEPPSGQTRGSAPTGLAGVGDSIYFSVTAISPGPSFRGLWRTEGTTDSTVRLSYNAAANMTAAADGSVFFAGEGGGGVELWRSQGTPETTARVRDIHPGGSSAPMGLTPLGNLMIFSAVTAAEGRELWSSDGTEAGTMLVRDFEPGPGSSEVQTCGVLDDCVILTRYGQVWRTQGRNENTFQLADFQKEAGFYSQTKGTRMGERVYWVVRNNASPTQYRIAMSDGTPEGTRFLPLEGITMSYLLTSTSSHLYFVASDKAHGAELWKTDGTPEGTSLVCDITPGPEGSQIWALTPVDDLVYFPFYSDSHGYELWVTDGTAGGTRMVRDIFPGYASGHPRALKAYRGKVYFIASTPEFGLEIWTSDGTDEGTHIVADVCPGAGGSGVWEMAFAGNRVYFPADSGFEGEELWAAAVGGSIADFDGSGGVNSQDFFEFLMAFFSGDARADVDVNGVIDSRDFFEFLTVFFGEG